MRILITNDDGIDSPGIQALVHAFKGEEVYVAAPDHQNSGMSHSVTYFLKDLTCTRKHIDGAAGAYALSGTPADCVYATVCGLFSDLKFDLVVSGINKGINCSVDAIYSGTIGAAEEGLLLQIPSMAVSLCSYTSDAFDTAAKTARICSRWYLQDPHRLEYLPSINVPNLPEEKIKGVRITQFDRLVSYARPMQKRLKEDGTIILHSGNEDIGMERRCQDLHGDASAIRDGWISITPIYLDRVNHEAVNQIGPKVHQ